MELAGEMVLSQWGATVRLAEIPKPWTENQARKGSPQCVSFARIHRVPHKADLRAVATLHSLCLYW